MQVNERINWIELIKKAEQVLSFPLSEESKTISMLSLDFHHLSNRESVICPYPKEDLFAPLLLLDRTNQIYYPVFFFFPSYSEKDGKRRISLSKQKPERNNLVKEILLEKNLLGKGKISYSSLEGFTNALSNQIESLMLRDKYSLVFSFSFFPKEVLLYHSIYPFLALSQAQQRKEDKYKGLFQEVKEEGREKALNEENIGFFSKQERSLLRREQYKASEVSYEEKEVFDDFLFRSILSALRKEHSLLLVVPNQEKEARNCFLEERSLKNRTLYFENLFPCDLKKLLKEKNNRDVGESNLSFREQRRESFEEKKDSCYLIPPFFRSEKRRDYFFKDENRKSSYSILDVGTYTNEEAEKDFSILEERREWKTILFSDLTRHPFYGLDSSGERMKFDYLRLLLIKREDNLAKIQNRIKENRKDYYKPLNNLINLDDRENERKFVERYDGFPLQRFTLSSQQSSLYPLGNLKKRFQAVSSIKLLVKDFFDDSIFSSDIQTRITEAGSSSFLERRKGKKKIKEHLKNKENPDYPTLIKRLAAYWKNYSFLQKNRPIYKKIYGENVATRSYVTEGETRRNYVHEFEKREKEDPSFSFKTPFILHLYQDGDYRRKFLSDAGKLNHLKEEFKKQTKEYRFYFPQEENVRFSLSFSECESLLEKRGKGNYEEFSEYASFHKARRSASWLRQETRKKKYILNHLPISSFQKEFFFSLYYSFYSAGKERFLPYQKDALLLNRQRKTEIKKIKNYDVIQLLAGLEETEKKKTKEVSYRDLMRNLTSNKSETMLNDEQGNPVFNLLSSRYPLSLATPADLALRKDNCFDEVLLLNSRLRDDVSLINGFRVGERILLLSPSSLLDNRIQGLHYTYLNNDGIYKKVIPFNQIPENLIKLFKDNQARYGYTFDTLDSRYPYRIKKKGRIDLGLFPSFLLSHAEDRQARYELNHYLTSELSFSLLYFITEELIFDTDKFFSSLFEDNSNKTNPIK